MTSIKKHISTIAILTGLLIPLSAYAKIQIKAEDTVAGLGTEIFIQGIGAQKNTDLVVIPPYGGEILMPLIIKTDGTANIEVSGEKTEVAGTYKVEVISRKETIATGAFEVVPETIDITKSTLQSNYKSLSANGQDTVRVTVILRDRYSNLLSGRPIKLISSRPNDIITPLSSETDENGTQEFEVSTYEAGSISLRAMDLMNGKLLENTIELSAGNTNAGVGGYPMPNNFGNTYPYQPIYTPPSNYQPTPYPVAPSRPLYSGNRIVGSVMGRSLYGQTNSFDVVSNFQIDIPSELKVNEDTTIRITALDQNGKRVEDYTGLVLLASTDPTALLPLEGRIQFLPQNLGEKVLTLGLRFRTPGEHLLYVEDSTNTNINGQTSVTVLGGSANGSDPTIKILSHKPNDKINSTEIQLEGTGPPFINLIVTGGVDDVRGETDVDGNFSITVDLNPGQIDHTLRIRDDSGVHDSGNIHLILDNTPPKITSVIFDPIEAIEEDTIELTVETEGDASKVTININEKEYELLKSKTQSGVFTLEFTAPEANTYQPIVKAIDDAGNSEEIRNNLIVKKKSLPKVLNVVANKNPKGVELSWDPITSDRVDAYRIYVGKNPNDFLNTFDTNRANATQIITGLNPGTTYFFAVTALQDDRESAEKSEVIKFTTPGTKLNITKNDGALLIEWENPVQDIPMSSYILEYGVEPDKYIEKRKISGELNAYQLNNLINGINYYIQLTPVATTGIILNEFSAKGQGMPVASSSGFTPKKEPGVPPDVLPASIIKNPPAGQHSGAPKQPKVKKSKGLPEVGLPLPIWIVLGISIIAFYFHLQRRRTMMMTMNFMKQMESRYRNHG